MERLKVDSGMKSHEEFNGAFGSEIRCLVRTFLAENRTWSRFEIHFERLVLDGLGELGRRKWLKLKESDRIACASPRLKH